MKCFFSLFMVLSIPGFMLGQNLIDIADLTIKIPSGKEELLYYGFASGDILIFNFKEVNGKELKEVEIIEYPSSTKFQAYETAGINDKRITVNKSGVYQFRFNNTALMKERVCSIKIQRIPKSLETADFNTGVSWIEKTDTVYSFKTETVVSGYEDVNKEKSRRVLDKVDTSFIILVDRVERVHSMTNLSSNNYSDFTFELPANKYYPSEILPLSSSVTVAWVYSIVVGDSGIAWYKDAEQKAAAIDVTNFAGQLGLLSTGHVGLAILAIKGLSTFSTPPTGDNVEFKIYSYLNDKMITYAYGDVVAATGRNIEATQGGFRLKLTNDNIRDGINVDVKIMAVQVNKKWKYETYTDVKQVPIKEERIVKTPLVVKTKVPILSN
jgi:hypothetical protein